MIAPTVRTSIAAVSLFVLSALIAVAVMNTCPAPGSAPAHYDHHPAITHQVRELTAEHK